MLLLLLVGGQSLLASGSSLRQEVKALAGGSVALRYRIDRREIITVRWQSYDSRLPKY